MLVGHETRGLVPYAGPYETQASQSTQPSTGSPEIGDGFALQVGRSLAWHFPAEKLEVNRPGVDSVPTVEPVGRGPSACRVCALPLRYTLVLSIS